MGTPKVILFYVFTPLADPEAVRLWQRTLAESLGLRGRVILSAHGINATLGGDLVPLKAYVRGLREYAPFKSVDIKWSTGRALDDGITTALFPRLSVKVRDEVVTFGAVEELEVDSDGVVGGGQRLTPAELNELVSSDDVVLLDGRNRIESAIGRFRGAVTPQVETTREFIDLIESGEWDHLKDRTVVTYCTGGIRCEVLTPLMRSRGFERVFQLDGGIARYGEVFGDGGLWEGSMYVFDARTAVDFSDRTAIIGQCDRCAGPSNDVRDCIEPSCVRQFVRCPGCAQVDANCSDHR